MSISHDMSSSEQTPTAKAAEVITPPNKLKEAVGTGGLEVQQIRSAQRALEVTATTTDFRPIALDILKVLSEAFDKAKSGTLQTPDALEGMMHPAMQLKAQGGMFKYTLVTDICNTLVNFLETLDALDRQALKIIEIYIKSINLIVKRSMSGDGGAQGKELRDALTDVCNRFYRRKMG